MHSFVKDGSLLTSEDEELVDKAEVIQCPLGNGTLPVVFQEGR